MTRRYEIYGEPGATDYPEAVEVDLLDVLNSNMHPQTSAESNEGITPSDYSYIEGDVKRYGATGDGVTDDTAALNTAMQLGANQGIAVYLSPGTYVITDTVWATVSGTTFQQVYIYGAGAQKSVIDHSAVTTKPGMNVNIARDVVLRGFSMLGPNLAPQALTQADYRYDSTWVTAGLRDSRYSPQCAISIDGQAGATPSDGGYPGFTYPGGTAGTARWKLEDINLNKNVVGLMINPGLGSQGDQGMLDNCRIENAKVCIASGQSQANCITVKGGTLTDARTAFDALEYGDQQGRSPVFLNVQFADLWELFSIAQNFNPLVVVGGRSETVHSFGYGTSGNTWNAVSVFNHDLNLINTLQTRAPHVFRFVGGINWYGGGIDLGNNDNNKKSVNVFGSPTVFEGARFDIFDEDVPAIWGGIDLNNTPKLVNCNMVGSSGDNRVYGETDRPLAISGRVQEHWNPSPHSINGQLYEYMPNPNEGNTKVNIGTMSNIAFTDTELSFDNTDAAGGLVVGDLVIWQTAAYGQTATQYVVIGAVIKSISAPTVTCDLLFPRAYYDEAYAPSATVIALPYWAPGESLTGDIASASATISNVSPTDILKNGDFITTIAGIPSDTRVVSGEGTATITMSRNATATVTGTPLYWDQLVKPINQWAFDTVRTLPSGDATPNVTKGRYFKTSGSTAITDFDGGEVGQEITILAHGAITITDGAAIILAGSTNFVMAASDTLTLAMIDDQVWQEVSRSVN